MRGSVINSKHLPHLGDILYWFTSFMNYLNFYDVLKMLPGSALIDSDNAPYSIFIRFRNKTYSSQYLQ